ncbi:MAG: GNAT family N-acetyltransferase [Deltaproteobacteria bacterium]|nr:GNAT family N-acetyltransferase [Deltaproteobacteria bacterium]
MNVEILDAHEHRAGPLWIALESDNRNYFLSWPWIDHWLSSLPRSHAPRLAILRDGNAAIAAGLFGRRRVIRHHVVPSRAWFLNATGDSRFDELAIEHNGLVGARVPLAALVAGLPEEWDELVLPAIDRDAFGTPIAEGVRVHVDREAACPYVDLQRVRDADGGYLGLLGPATRAHLRRARRVLGELTVEIATDPDHALDIFGELVELCPDAFADPWFERFHRDLIAARYGECELVRVRNGAQTIGCLYNFAYRRRVLCYQSGLASFADPHVKPALVCHAAAIANAAARGDDVYDFLVGDGRYKQHLATGTSHLRWLRVQQPRIRFSIEDRLRDWKHALAR